MAGASAHKHKKGQVAVLDIGSHKLACFIAEQDENERYHIKGIGHQLAKGFRAGMITDAKEAETSVRCTVHAAEEMADETIENVVVSMSGTHIKSHLVSVEMAISGDGVSERDVSDVLHEGCQLVQDKDRALIHCFASEYQLDGSRGIKDPLTMYGSQLGADLHIITADAIRQKNLLGCMSRCHLNIEEYVSSSHVAALGCLEPDEMELGVTLIDMGAGQTSVSVFSGGKNIYSFSIPIGGQHVTKDIATGLSTSIANAERLKNLHGSAIDAPQDAQAMIDIPQLGEEDDISEGSLVPRSMLIGVIRPRLEEVFEMVREKLEASGVNAMSGRNVVLTGGASQLIGMRDLTARMLGGKQVRLGKPHYIPGLADSVTGPAFSSVVGMLKYLENRPAEDALFHARKSNKSFAGSGTRLWQWVKTNF